MFPSLLTWHTTSCRIMFIHTQVCFPSYWHTGPNYIELPQYLTSVQLMEKLISGRLSFHLPKNTSTQQPLCVVTFPSTSLKTTSPSITITQQKPLCAESNYIRHAAGSDKRAERSDSWSDWWLFITHANEEQVKVKLERQKTVPL